MALMRRQFLALLLINSLSISSAALADSSVQSLDDRLAKNAATIADHLNSFAMIFGHCVWIPPSPKAALAAFSLFFGVDTTTAPDIEAAETAIASEYIVAGKSQSEANKEVAWLNACFATYEVPPENRNHPQEPGVAQHTPTSQGADR